MRTRAFALVAVGVSLFAACDEGDIAVGGTGGAAAGASGSAGKGGSSGSAGKGGTTGGSAGSNATGGGSGEGSSGETGTGGTAGEAGSGSSAGGSAGESGAPSGAGAPGAGGSGGSGDLCEMGCVATLAADCENGPNGMQQCVSDCRDLLDGRCSEEYETLRTCAVGEEITCGQMGYPIIEACSDEQSEFRDCMN